VRASLESLAVSEDFIQAGKGELSFMLNMARLTWQIPQHLSRLLTRRIQPAPNSSGEHWHRKIQDMKTLWAAFSTLETPPSRFMRSDSQECDVQGFSAHL